MNLYKYSGAGNDFVVLDGRGLDAGIYRQETTIRELCDRRKGFVAADGRIGADGLMILDNSERADFRMEFYNPDGSSGMMCGNGGRCIVAFARLLGIKPADRGADAEGKYLFEAPDGLHSASIVSEEGRQMIVSLKMIDVQRIDVYPDGYFLNTGTRHFVCFCDDVEQIDVRKEGAALRHDSRFAPEGSNVNFVSRTQSGIKLRTFEKGVEDETLACGTGITASAIAAYRHGIAKSPCEVRARQDTLQVSFTPDSNGAHDIYLTGPATLIE